MNKRISTIHNLKRYPPYVAVFLVGSLMNFLFVTFYIDNNIKNQINPGRHDTIQPFIEFGDFCNGFHKITNTYTKQEVQGYISADNKMILTAIGKKYEVVGPKPIYYQGQYYLPWNKTYQTKYTYLASIQYNGSEHLFIPVKAMFHTHVAYGSISRADLETASKYPELSHLLIDHLRVRSFDGDGEISSQQFTKHTCPSRLFLDRL